MNLPDAVSVSPPPDYAVLGLSLTDEVEAQWVTPVAADAMAQVLACERRGLRGVVVELDEHGAVPVEVRKVMARALAQGSSGGARQESKGARDPRAEVGRWLARLLESTSVSAEGAALTSWLTAAAKWAAYFPNLPSSAVRTLAGLTDGAGWDQFRAEASELIDLLRHVDNFYADPSTCATERVRPLSYYTRGFQRLRAACEAAPELRQAAEFYLLQAVRSSQEAAEVAGFVGAESKDMFGWAQDRFGEDSEVVAAAQARAARWRTARELSVADRRRAARWLAQHPSARRETRMIGIWSAQRGPGGPAGGERQVALQVEQESAEAQREARYALWAYLDEYEAELSVSDPVRRGRSRDQWLRHREEAERLAGAAFLSVAHAAADLERVLRAVGAALEAGEKGFMEFASEWRALQAASAALQGLLPADPAETVIPGLGWGKWQRPVPMLYRLVVTSGVPEDGVTSEPLAAVLWWLRRDRPENRVRLSCSDTLGQWQALTIRSLLRRIRYVALSTQERAELDGALAVWLLAEGEWHTAGKDWHRMGRRWAEVLSDAPPRASLLTRLRALGHGKTADVTVLQQGAALLGDEEDGGAAGASIPAESGLAIPLDRGPGVSQSVLLESARAGGTCYVHASLPESGRTVVGAIRPTGEGTVLADSRTVDTSRLFTAVVREVLRGPEALPAATERQVVADETAAFASRTGQDEQAPWVAYLRDVEEEYVNGQVTLAQYTEAAEQAWSQLIQLNLRLPHPDGRGRGDLNRWYEVGSSADLSGPGEVHLNVADALGAWAERDLPDERFVIVTGEIAVPGRRILRLADVPVADLIGPDPQVSGVSGSQVAAALASWVERQARSTALLDGIDSVAWMRAGWAWGLVFGTPLPETVVAELVDRGLPGGKVQEAARTIVATVAQLQHDPSAAESRNGWVLLAAAAATWEEAVGPSRDYLDRLLPEEGVAQGADDSDQPDSFLIAARRIGFIAYHSGAPALGAAYRAAARSGQGATDLTELSAMPSRMLGRAIEVQKRSPQEADRAFQAAEALAQSAALLSICVEEGYPEGAVANLRRSVREARGRLSAVCRQQATGLTDDRATFGSASTQPLPRSEPDMDGSAGN